MKEKKNIWVFGIIISALLSMWASEQGLNLYYFLKPLTTILILLLPICFGQSMNKKYYRLTIVALACCLIGDSFLLFDQYFIFGLIAFLCGHLCFALSFMSWDGIKKHILPLLILVGIGAGMFTYLYSHLGALKIPVAVYVSVIVFMSWQGIGLYLWERRRAFLFVAIGVSLFLLSDAILAINKFRTPIPMSGIWILSTYWGAISCLAYATTK